MPNRQRRFGLALPVRAEKPKVVILATGGTIAGSADSQTQAGYASGQVGVDVLIVANDDIHGARGITKTSTTDVETFLSPERGLIGVSLYGKNRYFRGPYRTHTAASEFSLDGVTALPRVDVIYITADVSPDLIDAAVAAGAKGLVTAGGGNGNMNAGALAAVGRAVEQGVVVVRATRLMGGAVGRNVEVDDDELGTAVAGELSPAKERVLLKLALLETRDPAAVQAYFDRY